MSRISIGLGTEFILNRIRYKLASQFTRKVDGTDGENELVFVAEAVGFDGRQEEFTYDTIVDLLNEEDPKKRLFFKNQFRPDDDGSEEQHSIFPEFNILGQKEKDEAEKRLKCIEPLLEKDDEGRSMTTRVKERIKQLKLEGINTSRSSLFLWRKRYLENGNDIRYLVDNNKDKGGKGDFRSIEEDVEKIVIKIFAEYYFVKERRPIKTVHKLVVAKIHHENVARTANKEKLLKVPEIRTLYRMAEKLNKYELAKKQYGALYVKTNHGYIGTMERPDRALEVVQMDSTPIDLFLVHDETGALLPRANFTAAIDMKTRYLVGMHIGFDKPGYKTTMLTLRNAISKKNIKKRYPFVKNDWLADGMPETILLDNGPEFVNKDLNNVCKQLGIKDEYCKIKQPWAKGIVERFLQTFNHQLSQHLRGTTFSDIKTKKDKEYDPEKNAGIGFNVFLEMFFEWLVDDYSIAFHKGIENFPVELWKESVLENPPHQYHDMEELKIMLCPYEERNIQNTGIHFENLIYQSPELWELKYEREMNGLKDKVICKYDPDDISKLYIYDDLKKKYIHVLCTHYDYAEGLNLHVHRTIRKEIGVLRRTEDTLTRSLATENILEKEKLEIKKHKKMSREAAKRNTTNINQEVNQKKLMEEQNRKSAEIREKMHLIVMDDEEEDVWGDTYYANGG